MGFAQGRCETRSFRWRWTCSCIPIQRGKGWNWPSKQEATGIVRRNDDEGQIASRESAKLVYGANSPYTSPARTGHHRRGHRSPTCRPWHDRTIGGKLIVGVSGDFDPVAMEARLRTAFEALPPVNSAPARHDVFPGPKPGISFIDKEDVNQSQRGDRRSAARTAAIPTFPRWR